MPAESTKVLVFDLLSYWHIGTGRGANAQADAIVARDPAGLPYLPGRTVRGLLRSAFALAVAAGRLPVAREKELFGSRPAGAGKSDGDEAELALEEGRFGTEPGRLWFGSAVLPAAWRSWAGSLPAGDPARAPLDELFTYVASTAIGADGVAKPHTLRVREVAVPLTLRAEVRGPADDPRWAAELQDVLGLVRGLGSRRQRGYGRVRVHLEEA